MRARALVVARLSKATGETLERSCRCASDLMWDLMCKGMRDLMCKGMLCYADCPFHPN